MTSPATPVEIGDPFTAPFGSLFGDQITIAKREAGGEYEYSGSAEQMENFSMHPATHALHYGSTCFEGLKAFRQQDGSLAIFRLDDHAARMTKTVAQLYMAVPDTELVKTMIIDAVEANAAYAPDSPGSLYIRPTLIGTQINIGAAATPSDSSMLFVFCSPVGDYFAGGVRPLTIHVETETPRTTPQFGRAKAGANYAMALGPTLDAKAAHGADQVLFASEGDITETGAANFFLVDDDRLITRELDDSFLHGVTRSSVLAIGADLGYRIEERHISLEELAEHAGRGEAFLSGTAAVIAPVGTLKLHGETVSVGDGQPGANTLKLRQALTDIQIGAAPDAHGWLTPVAG